MALVHSGKPGMFTPGNLSGISGSHGYRVRRFDVAGAQHRCATTYDPGVALYTFQASFHDRRRAFAIGRYVGDDWNELDSDGKQQGYYPHLQVHVSTRGADGGPAGEDAATLLAGMIAGINSQAHLGRAQFPTRLRSALTVGFSSLPGAAVGCGLAWAAGFPLLLTTGVGQLAAGLLAWYRAGKQQLVADAQIMHGASLLIVADDKPLFGIVRSGRVVLNSSADDGDVPQHSNTVHTAATLNALHPAAGAIERVWNSGAYSPQFILNGRTDSILLAPRYPVRLREIRTGADLEEQLTYLAPLERTPRLAPASTDIVSAPG